MQQVQNNVGNAAPAQNAQPWKGRGRLDQLMAELEQALAHESGGSE